MQDTHGEQRLVEPPNPLCSLSNILRPISLLPGRNQCAARVRIRSTGGFRPAPRGRPLAHLQRATWRGAPPRTDAPPPQSPARPAPAAALALPARRCCPRTRARPARARCRPPLRLRWRRSPPRPKPSRCPGPAPAASPGGTLPRSRAPDTALRARSCALSRHARRRMPSGRARGAGDGQSVEGRRRAVRCLLGGSRVARAGRRTPARARGRGRRPWGEGRAAARGSSRVGRPRSPRAPRRGAAAGRCGQLTMVLEVKRRMVMRT
jgi:hypothetical protein